MDCSGAAGELRPPWQLELLLLTAKGDTMKRSLRFAALVTALSLTTWLTVAQRPAYALPICEFLEGKACTGGSQNCKYSGGGYGICYCLEGGHWDCSY